MKEKYLEIARPLYFDRDSLSEEQTMSHLEQLDDLYYKMTKEEKTEIDDTCHKWNHQLWSGVCTCVRVFD